MKRVLVQCITVLLQLYLPSRGELYAYVARYMSGSGALPYIFY